MSSEERNKVLFVIRSLNIGGAERQLIELAGGLRRAGWDVSLATFYGGGALEPLLASHHVRHVSLRKRGRWDVLPFLWRLVKLVRAERPDVVYTMLTMSNVVAGLLRPFFGDARVVWGVATSNMDLSYYDWLAKVECALEVRLARRADLIVCNSVAGRDHHAARGYPAARTVVVVNGIDSEKFRPDAVARREVRAELGIAADEVVVGVVGRLDPIKDHPNFLAAAAKIAQARRDVRFLCVGDGTAEYREKLVALSRNLGIAERLLWIAERTDIWRIYNALDVGVSSSISEGLTNVIAEAMACGVPCVATAVGDSARLVANPRWLCRPRDSVALTRTILNAIEDLPCAPETLRQRITAEYPLNGLVEHTVAHLKRILRSPRRSPDPAEPADLHANAPKIVLLTRRLDVGGAQRQLVELATGLDRAGWKVKVLTFYEGGALAEELERAGVDMESIGKRGRWDIVPFVWRLLARVRREAPDIVHGYLATSNVVLSLLRPLLRPARVVWGVRASNMDLTRYDRLAALESRVAVRLSHFSDLIICNSEAGRAYHAEQGYPKERMVVVQNGIDVNRFAPDADARRTVRAEWNVTPEEVLFGMVGRLDPMKDHRNFLSAAAEVARSHPAARFVCVGDGPAAYRRELTDEARRLGLEHRLVWAGARDDMSRVYNGLDIAVSASSFGEGFPNTIVEAMATGVPCVVTDVGDSARIVDRLGWVCPPSDCAALARALVAALDALPCDPARIREHVAKAYSSAMLVERTVAQLAPLVAHRALVAGASMGGNSEY
jgi:glycosyltransferase involved in cell wall biosynthesis